MQRHGQNPIPLAVAQNRRGFADEQVGQKRFKPQRALIFVAVNDLQDHATGGDGGARGTEMQFHLAAIATFKHGGDRAFKWQPATITKRRTNEAHQPPASRADQSFDDARAFFPANLADLGIDKRQRRTKKFFAAVENWPHCRRTLITAWLETKSFSAGSKSVHAPTATAIKSKLVRVEKISRR